MGWGRALWSCFVLVLIPVVANGTLPPLRVETFRPEADADGEWFGAAVAVDGNTAVVGAHQSSEAYVFVREQGVWQQQATLQGDGGLFGGAVDVDADTIVVAAPLEAHNGVSSGVVHVFTRSDGVWTEASKLVPGDAAPGSWFGSAVAIDGDTISSARVII